MQKRICTLLTLWASACSPEQRFGHATESEDYAARIAVDPAELDFGALDAGQARSLPVTVENVGNATLWVEPPWVDASGAFVVESADEEFSLVPGETREVVVTYTSRRQDDVGELVLESTDPVEPELRVGLSGAGLYPALSLGPDPFALGEHLTDCGPVQGELTLVNEGEGEATVTEIGVMGGSFRVVEPTGLPLLLASGEELPVIVESLATTDGDWSGTVYVRSDDPTGDVTAELSLTTLTQVKEDLFAQGAWAETDLLLTVDRSCSMEDDTARLAAELPEFIAALEEIGTEFQLAVVTADSGCHNETLFTLDTEDAESTFKEAVFGTSGGYTEAGFRLAVEALEASTEGGCNEGFLRDGARVSILHLTDEPEQSGLGVSRYLGEVQSFTENATVSAVAGPVPTGCATAAPGTFYDEAASESGGFFVNFCEVDWTDVAADLAELSVGLPVTDTFELRETPWEDTITVEVDGVPTSDWLYYAESNAVRLDEEPEYGAHILITYEYGTCDETAER